MSSTLQTNKVVVVLRKLRPVDDTVVTAVVQIPENNISDSGETPDSYIQFFEQETLKNVREAFCKRFVEFKHAEWTSDVHDVVSNFRI